MCPRAAGRSSGAGRRGCGGDVVGQAVVVDAQTDERHEHSVGDAFVAGIEVPGEVEEASTQLVLPADVLGVGGEQVEQFRRVAEDGRRDVVDDRDRDTGVRTGGAMPARHSGSAYAPRGTVPGAWGASYEDARHAGLRAEIKFMEATGLFASAVKVAQRQLAAAGG